MAPKPRGPLRFAHLATHFAVKQNISKNPVNGPDGNLHRASPGWAVRVGTGRHPLAQKRNAIIEVSRA